MSFYKGTDFNFSSYLDVDNPIKINLDNYIDWNDVRHSNILDDLSRIPMYYQPFKYPQSKNIDIDMESDDAQDSSSFLDKLISAAKAEISLGKKYNYKARYDCSGVIRKLFSDIGYNLSGTSNSMYRNDVDIIDPKDIKPGDLIFLTLTHTRNVAGSTRRAGIDTAHVAAATAPAEVNEKTGSIKVHLIENTPSSNVAFHTYEIGNPNLHEKGVLNYARGIRDFIFFKAGRPKVLLLNNSET